MSVFPATFFGLTIQPGQTYSTTFEEDTHITMASLAATLPKNAGRTSVIIEISGAKFTICSLTPSKSENQTLDIYINENDEVSFSVVGPCPVDLTGNNIFILPPAGQEDSANLAMNLKSLPKRNWQSSKPV
jgi:Nucleoplasmin-like domain